MNGSSRPTPELLLEQVSWLRALARSLVADRSLADDLAQEAVVVALERPPRDATRLRAWLARVLRSKVRAEARSGAARRVREEERPPPAAPEAPDELVLRLHLQRTIADELLALDEPYRGTILLRFYEDLPPREIARRQGVSVATVKSRLHRGLGKLRERLDASHGGERRAWVLTLLPLAREPLPVLAGAAAAKTLAPVTGGLGGLLVNMMLLFGALALFVLGGTWLALRGDARVAVEPTAAAPAALASGAEPSATPPLARGTAAPAARTPVDAPREPQATAPPGSEPAPVPATLATVVGRVVDAQARAIDGLALRLEGDEETVATTADGGRFRFPTDRESVVVDVHDEEWVAIRKGTWSAGSSLAPLVMCAPAVDIGGRVRDEDGAPIDGARTLVVLPAGLWASVEEVPDASLQVEWSGWSDAAGGFLLEDAPLVPGMRLFVARDGYEPVTLDDVDGPLDRLEVVLRRLSAGEEPALRGRVVLPDGSPAWAARVALGLTSVPTDDGGFFTLPLGRALETGRLVAAQEGYVAAVLERPGSADEPLAGWPPFLEVVLADEARTITGRVVDHEGRPCEGAYVWIEDPTPFGTVGTLPLFVESWAAGGRVPERAVDSLARMPDEDGDEDFGSATPLGEPSAMLFHVRTDPDGGFALTGLLERDYDLRVLDDELRWDVTVQDVPAGSRDREVRIPRPAVHPRFEGRVVTRHGDPVEGVRVLQWTAALELRTRVFGGSAHVTRFLMGPEAVTDADGRVVFEDLPRERIEFYIASDDILPAYASVEDVADPLAAEIVVSARAHLSLAVEPADLVDEIAVSDVDGELQTIHLMRADGYSNFETFPLTGGRTGVVTVTSDAAFVHLISGDREIDRLPLVLRPGELNPLTYSR